MTQYHMHMCKPNSHYDKKKKMAGCLKTELSHVLFCWLSPVSKLSLFEES